MYNLIIKRDGRVVPFDESKIRSAIYMALSKTNSNNMQYDSIVNTITKDVLSAVEGTDDIEITVEQIQDMIVKSMYAHNMDKLAEDYTEYRNERTLTRNKKTSLMKTINDMAFQDSSVVADKRENANIDGNTAMGTMLKYGTTVSKEFYLNSVINPVASKAHRDGDIHIHDLDFYSLTTTCLTADTNILLRINNQIIPTTFEYFDECFSSDEDTLNYLSDMEIFYNGEFTDIKWVSRRKVKPTETVYKISTGYDTITMTESHRVPIIRDNEKQLVFAKDIRIGDKLITSKPVDKAVKETIKDSSDSKFIQRTVFTADLTECVKSIEIVNYTGFVYDIETDSHYFTANSFVVHNCTQIDIGKLLAKGFSTGHGHLRTPNSIISASALTCIIIQSNQNDQHKLIVQ